MRRQRRKEEKLEKQLQEQQQRQQEEEEQELASMQQQQQGSSASRPKPTPTQTLSPMPKQKQKQKQKQQKTAASPATSARSIALKAARESMAAADAAVLGAEDTFARLRSPVLAAAPTTSGWGGEGDDDDMDSAPPATSGWGAPDSDSTSSSAPTTSGWGNEPEDEGGDDDDNTPLESSSSSSSMPVRPPVKSAYMVTPPRSLPGAAAAPARGPAAQSTSPLREGNQGGDFLMSLLAGETVPSVKRTTNTSQMRGLPSTPLPPPPGFSPHRGPPIPLNLGSTSGASGSDKAHKSKYGYTVRW